MPYPSRIDESALLNAGQRFAYFAVPTVVIE
jgi:hypothetical protein